MSALQYEDEPVPGYPLPIRPGHSSPGRLERVLRDGHFAVTSELMVMSMRSTQPMAVVLIVIWAAWRCAHYSHDSVTRSSCKYRVAIKTVLLSKATYSVVRRWVCATCSCFPAMEFKPVITHRQNPFSI